MEIEEKTKALARAVFSTSVVHFAPDGKTPVCGEVMETEVVSDDPGQVAGCTDCLKRAVVAESGATHSHGGASRPGPRKGGVITACRNLL